MLEFIGRFHPVFVHLPIGILLLACVLILLSLKKRFEGLRAAIPLTLFLGAISAIFSCVTGYFLANSGDYDFSLVNTHQWMGIAVAVLSVILWFVNHSITAKLVRGIIALVLIALISITGHLGGSLTHGSDYLTAPITSGTAKDKAAIPQIADVQEAYVYQNAIQPLLQSRCYSCHGAEKQKGKLRLDTKAGMLKGGEEGSAIVPGNAEESNLMKRILLPLSDEDHMAPKEKPQLTLHEIELLKWWINNGADFNKRFKELPQPQELKPVLVSLQSGVISNEGVKNTDVPTEQVEPANQSALDIFRNANIMVVPIAQNSNYLTANFVNTTSFADSVQKSIGAIKDQLLWVKLDHKKVNDGVLAAFEKCKNVTKLSLNGAAITDLGLKSLKDLVHLQSLSLVGTKVTIKGLAALSKLKKLKYIYLYQTGISAKDMVSIKKIFPLAVIDTGNYIVPTLPQDTIEVKAQ